MSLSNSLQRALTDLEVTVAVEARGSAADHCAGDDLLVVDGPLRGRAHLREQLVTSKPIRLSTFHRSLTR